MKKFYNKQIELFDNYNCPDKLKNEIQLKKMKNKNLTENAKYKRNKLYKNVINN